MSELVGPKLASDDSTKYAPGARMVPAAIRYLVRLSASSLRYQLPISIEALVVFFSSTQSPGETSEWASSSLIAIECSFKRPESSAPGVPPAYVLAAQLSCLFQLFASVPASKIFREKPSPSVESCQLST